MIDIAETVREAQRRTALAAHVELAVLKASAEELAAHRAQLADIEKASQGRCLWQAADEEKAPAGT
jgi:DNA polymerase-3 subunit epsilon